MSLKQCTDSACRCATTRSSFAANRACAAVPPPNTSLNLATATSTTTLDFPIGSASRTSKKRALQKKKHNTRILRPFLAYLLCIPPLNCSPLILLSLFNFVVPLVLGLCFYLASQNPLLRFFSSTKFTLSF